jgi:hypothetical protein
MKAISPSLKCALKRPFFCAIISALLIFYVSQIEEERFLALFVASLPLGIGTIFGGAWLYIRHRRMLLAMGRL